MRRDRSRSIFGGLLLLSVASCSEAHETPPDASTDAGVSDDTGAPPVLRGTAARVYDDVGGEDRTRRVDGIDADDAFRSGVTVRLLGADREGVTGPDGVVRFDGVAAGTYLFDTGFGEATTHNVADGVVAAVDGGALKITAFGDSLPVYGGSPRFDAVLETLLTPLVSVERVNVAVEGSTTIDWAAGASERGRLEPHIEDTDLFLVSLGGDDFLYYIEDLFYSGGMDAVLEALEGGARDEALAIADRVLAIIDGIRVRNPTADFAYLVYPAYAESDQWQSLIRSSVSPDLVDIALLLIEDTLRSLIRAILDRLSDEDLVLVDLFKLTQAEPIDPFLVDPLHFTAYGHRRVGEEIFLSVGGIVVGGAEVLEAPYEVGLR